MISSTPPKEHERVDLGRKRGRPSRLLPALANTSRLPTRCHAIEHRNKPGSNEVFRDCRPSLALPAPRICSTRPVVVRSSRLGDPLRRRPYLSAARHSGDLWGVKFRRSSRGWWCREGTRVAPAVVPILALAQRTSRLSHHLRSSCRCVSHGYQSSGGGTSASHGSSSPVEYYPKRGTMQSWILLPTPSQLDSSRDIHVGH